MGWWSGWCCGSLDLFIFRVEEDELLVGEAVAEIVSGAAAVGTSAGGFLVEGNQGDLPETTSGLVVANLTTERAVAGHLGCGNV